jgi:plasmid replication initiation protein
MAAIQLVLPGTIVKKSNVLCRARWGVESVYEPRLVALVAARVHVSDKDFQKYEIPVRELLTEKNDGGNTYDSIESITQSLMSRVLKIQEEGSRDYDLYNVFSKCTYKDKTKTIIAEFHPDLKPHYLGLGARFAEYNLLEYMKLSSIYSQRIFEILKSWADKPEVTINIAELYEMLDVPLYLRKDFGNFRNRVLAKAHKEISAKTTFKYKWEPLAKDGKEIKRGRPAVAIRFIFSEIRIEKAQKEEEKKEKAKIEQDNTSNFQAAIHCFGLNSAGRCRKDQKKAVCEICKSHLQNIGSAA